MANEIDIEAAKRDVDSIKGAGGSSDDVRRYLDSKGIPYQEVRSAETGVADKIPGLVDRVLNPVYQALNIPGAAAESLARSLNPFDPSSFRQIEQDLATSIQRPAERRPFQPGIEAGAKILRGVLGSSDPREPGIYEDTLRNTALQVPFDKPLSAGERMSYGLPLDIASDVASFNIASPTIKSVLEVVGGLGKSVLNELISVPGAVKQILRDVKFAAKSPGVTSLVTEEELVKRGNVMLQAIRHDIDPSFAVDNIIEFQLQGMKRPNDKTVADMKRSLGIAMGRADRYAAKAAHDVLEALYPRNVSDFIRKTRDADVPLVMDHLVDMVGNQVLGRRVSTFRDRQKVILALNERIGKNDPQLRKAVSEMVDGMGFESLAKVRKKYKFSVIVPEIEQLHIEHRLKDVTKFGGSFTDFDRLASNVDDTGTLNFHLVRPVFEGETKALEKTDELMKAWNDRYPQFSRGSKESAILQRYINNRLFPEDKLPANTKRASEDMRHAYNQMLFAINKKFDLIGRKPIPFMDDFTTQFKGLSALDDMIGLMNASDDQIKKASEFAHPNSPFFRSEFERLGGEFEDDAVKGFFKYAHGAHNVINLVEPIARISKHCRIS